MSPDASARRLRSVSGASPSGGTVLTDGSAAAPHVGTTASDGTRTVPADVRDLRLGRLGLRVVGVLGAGGHGEVLAAVDTAGRRVAVKRVRRPVDPAMVARLQREADALARLDHPGVLRLERLEILDDDVILVVPLLEGGTLADRVARGRPDAAETVALAHRLSDALRAAHSAGVVHRDITPTNILFDGSGNPVLADFGTAVLAGAAPLTAPGTVVGTPAFVAPEQARGEPAGPATDLFSLAATLMWAHRGWLPWGTGAPAEVLARAAAGHRAPLPPDLDHRVAATLGPWLDPDPRRRGDVPVTDRAGTGAGHGGTGPVATGRRRTPFRALARAPVVVGPVVIALAVIGLAAAVSRDGAPAASGPVGDAPARGTDTGGEAGPPPEPCEPLPYQPCGGRPAPHTDGRRCLVGYADYDGVAANGCEVVADRVDGSRLERRITANLVPADDVDRYPVEVTDRWQLLCDGTLRIVLTAPAGGAARLVVTDGTGAVLGTVTSADGEPGTVSLRDPSCGRDDSTTLIAEVRPVGTPTAGDYVLERHGSW